MDTSSIPSNWSPVTLTIAQMLFKYTARCHVDIGLDPSQSKELLDQEWICIWEKEK
jgi:hypothetical protein